MRVDAILSVALAALGGPRIVGNTPCPTPVEVEAALVGLVAEKGQPERPDVAELRADGDAVVVSLTAASGALVAQKHLDAQLSCAERARTAAVAIAAWRATLVPTAPTLSLGEPPAPLRRPATAATALATAAPLSPHNSPFRVELGASLGAAVDRVAVAPAGRLELALPLRSVPLVPVLAALGEGSRTQGLGPGSVRWRRYGLAAGLGLRHSWRLVWVEGRLSGLLTLLDIAGRSYPSNADGLAIDPGVSLAARLGVGARSFLPWIEATGVFWPRDQTVYVGGTGESARLPPAEVLLSVGVSFTPRH